MGDILGNTEGIDNDNKLKIYVCFKEKQLLTDLSKVCSNSESKVFHLYYVSQS